MDTANFLAICIALNFFVLGILIIVNFRTIACQFNKIKKKTWLLLFLIFFAGFFIRFAVPHYHKMYIDEQWNMEVGKNILASGRAVQCNYAGYDELSCITSVKPVGVSFIYSLAFLFFGIDNFVAIDTSAFFGSLSVFLIFLVSYLLFKNENAGLFSALFLSLFPLHVFWSASAETNVISIFFVLLTLLCFLVYFKVRYIGTFLLAIVSFTYALQTRIEYVLTVPVITLLFLLSRDKWDIYVKNKRFWVSFFICALFFISWAVQVYRYHDFLGSNYVFSNDLDESLRSVNFGFCYLQLQYLEKNVHYYGSKMLEMAYFPFVFAVSMIFGLLNFRKNRRGVILVSAFFMLFFAVFMTYEAVQVRLLLTPFLGLVLLAGFGAEDISARIMKAGHGKVCVVLFIILMLVSFYPSLKEVYAYKDDKKVLETQIPEMLEKSLAENCVVIAPLPEIFTATTGTMAIRSDTVVKNQSIMKDLASRTECILFFEDMACQGLELRNFKGYIAGEQQIKTKERLEKECKFVENSSNLTFYRAYNSYDKNLTYIFYKIFQEKFTAEDRRIQEPL